MLVWCVLLGLVALISGITTPNQCTNEAASVVVPGDESVTFTITQTHQILCWNLLVSQDDLNENKLLLDYEIEDNEYLLQQDVYVTININYNCTEGICQSHSFTDEASFCVDTSGYTTSNSFVPIAASLETSSGSLFAPSEIVTIQFNLRWSDTECSSQGNNNIWIAFVVIGIFVLAIPLVLLAIAIVYLKKRKKLPKEYDHPIKSPTDSYYE